MTDLVATTRTIREATREDLPSVRALLGRDDLPLGEPGRHHVLVLEDDDGALCAVAVVAIEAGRGHLVSLAITDTCAGEGVENRLIGVAEALCTAFGATTLDVQRRAG